MPRPSRGPRLGSGPDHERLVLASMSASLFFSKKVRTTLTRAKRLRPFAEKLVTISKRGDLHNRRRALSILRNKSAVHELFENIAPLARERAGGYTRITRIGFRPGDAAPMALVELILEPVSATDDQSDSTSAQISAASQLDALQSVDSQKADSQGTESQIAEQQTDNPPQQPESEPGVAAELPPEAIQEAQPNSEPEPSTFPEAASDKHLDSVESRTEGNSVETQSVTEDSVSPASQTEDQQETSQEKR